ncbi:MAG TPA: hypothetical protein VIH93_00470, partial [Thermoanaerobaculia bacterium]
GQLIVIAEGYATKWIAEDDEADEDHLREIRLADGHEITGRFLGLQPRDLAAASLSAAPLTLDPASRMPLVTGTVDAHGGYRLAGLTPGVWVLFAKAGGRSLTARVTVEPGERAVVQDLTFDRPGR